MATEDYWEMLHEQFSENRVFTKNCNISTNGDKITWKFQVVAAIMVVVLAGLPILLNERRENVNANSAAAWWETSIMYHIYLRSFKDSQSDGVGDFRVHECLPFIMARRNLSSYNYSRIQVDDDEISDPDNRDPDQQRKPVSKRAKRGGQSECNRKQCWYAVVSALTLLVVTAVTGVLCSYLNMSNSRPVIEENTEWWKNEIVYQIYPRSFKDSDGDGIGDMKGIISKLDYLSYLSVGAVWISPFYPSPMLDGGYDVSNFTEVDPVFGTLEDFDNLLREAHKRDIRVIIDFVAGHTSSDHQWFQNSVKRIPPFTDFYIWANGIVQENGTVSPPSNWMSTFGHSAWTWRKERQQFYYHAYLPQQPNLNYGNPAVRQSMKEVIRFWMDRGVDGLRVDAVYHLMVARDHYPDKPRSFRPGFEPWQAKYYDNRMTQNIPEIGPIVLEWRDVLNTYANAEGKNNSKFMVVEVHDPPKVRNRYYDYGADMTFNFDLLKALRNSTCDAVCFYKHIKAEYESLPAGRWPNFVLSNHDSARASSRMGVRYADALHVLLLTLRGTPTTYYGEEIGMEDVNVTYEDTQDAFGKNYGPDSYQTVSRDPGRTPMQWDDTVNAGFTTAPKPWLPVHPNYRTVNVEAQKNAKSMTTLKVYRKLSVLRKETLVYGELQFCVVTSRILSYIRTARPHTTFLVVVNLGNETETNDFSGVPVERSEGRVKVATSGACNEGRFVEDRVVSLSSLILEPGDGLVLELL